MSKPAFKYWLEGTMLASLVGAGAASAQNASPPDLSSDNTGWVSIGTDWDAAPGGPPPVTFDSAHPYVPNGSGKQLTALVTVDDPDTFNEPIHMKQTWHKVVNPLLETVCAENNNDSIFFHQKLFPMPEAAKPDF